MTVNQPKPEHSAESARRPNAAVRESERWAPRQIALAELAQHALAGAEAETLAADVARAVAHLMRASHVDVVAPTPDNGVPLGPIARFGWAGEQATAPEYPVTTDSFATAVLAAPSPVTVPRIDAERRFRLPPHVTAAGLASAAAIALGGERQPNGLLAVYSDRPRDFDACDLAFLRSLSLVLGGALSSQRRRRVSEKAFRDLEAELRQRLSHLKLLRDVAALTGSERPSATIIESAVGLICERQDWPFAHTFMLAAEDQATCGRIWWPPISTLLRKSERNRHTSYDSLDLNDLHRAVLNEGRAQWSRDLSPYRQSLRLLDRSDTPVSSVLAIPLHRDQKTVGIAEFFLPQASSPSPDLLATLVQVGGQLGGVVAHARVSVLLENREHCFAQLTEAYPGLVALLDRDCRFRFANSAHHHWFGLATDMIQGQTLPAVWDRAAATAAGPHIQEVLAGRRRVFHTEVHHSELGPRIVSVVLTPHLDDDGGVEGFYLVGSDITARKEAERNVSRQQTQLAQLNRSAVLGEVAGSIAHDLNQPLSAIVSYAAGARRRLRDGRLTEEESTTVLERIDEMAQRAGRALNRLREFAQRSDSNVDTVDLNAVADHAISLSETIARDANATVTLDTEPALPAVEGHADQLQQLVTNLIVNAIESVQGNPPDAPRRIEVRTAVNADGQVQLSVSDSGPPTSEDALARIFEPFYTTKPEGLGMGLAIGSSVAEAHGGRLVATPGLERGVTLTLSLPPPAPPTA